MWQPCCCGFPPESSTVPGGGVPPTLCCDCDVSLTAIDVTFGPLLEQPTEDEYNCNLCSSIAGQTFTLQRTFFRDPNDQNIYAPKCVYEFHQTYSGPNSCIKCYVRIFTMMGLRTRAYDPQYPWPAYPCGVYTTLSIGTECGPPCPKADIPGQISNSHVAMALWAGSWIMPNCQAARLEYQWTRRAMSDWLGAHGCNVPQWMYHAKPCYASVNGTDPVPAYVDLRRV